MGAEKFFDIKCRKSGIKPSAVVVVATIKALKYHGGVNKSDIYLENDEALKKGLANLVRHIENIKKYGVNVVVCLNKYDSDLDSEIKVVEDCCEKNNVLFSISSAYVDGGNGAIDVAQKVISLCSLENKFKLLYDDNLSIVEKIKKIAVEIYRAVDVEFSAEVMKKIEEFENKNLSYLPICVAKTQYSFSDDPKAVGAPVDFKIRVRDIQLYNGAEFIVVLLSDIMTMPGLSKKPNYEKIDLVNEEIVGLS